MRREPMTVAQFVEQAFPDGTIPRGDHNAFDDFSFNYAEYGVLSFLQEAASGKVEELGGSHWSTVNNLEINERRRPWPIWPPDLFGCTHSLIELSGIYQRIRANCLEKCNLSPDQEDFDRLFSTEMYFNSSIDLSDPFFIHGLDMLLLRFAGALWASGALMVSGLSVTVKLDCGSSKIAFIQPGNLSKNNQSRIKEALGTVRSRLNKEFSESDFTKLYDCISTLVIRKFYEGDFSNIKNDVNSISMICFKIIDMELQERKSAGQSKEEIILYLKSKVKEEAVILWACNFIQNHWSLLLSCKDPISPGAHSAGEKSQSDTEGKSAVPTVVLPWQRAAVRLHILADEAGKGIGYRLGDLKDDVESNGMGVKDSVRAEFPLQIGLNCPMTWSTFTKNRFNDGRNRSIPRTLTRCFNDDLGSVLPKARTPGAGCSLRSLSHNLSFVQPRGRVRARWAGSPASENKTTFNALLVPFPYNIQTKHVKPNRLKSSAQNGWGYFSIEPIWLYESTVTGLNTDSLPYDVNHEDGSITIKSDPQVQAYMKNCHKALWLFVKSLLKDQGNVGNGTKPGENPVDAIVFPEGCLDWFAFEYLQEKIQKEAPFVHVLIAGLTSAKKSFLAHYASEQADRKEQIISGNFVATYVRSTRSAGSVVKSPSGLESPHAQADGSGDSTIQPSAPVAPTSPWMVEHVRSKHHRWRLDKGQLQSYAFSSQLYPDRYWWEDIDILSRELLFAEFSVGSVLTSLICEDLARIDPCQDVLRAIGPNLIFVLLMDAAQVTARWPYQYAGVLTDDPGSSVLTLTSFGLIQRSSLSEGHKSRSIAIWREPFAGAPQEIELPQGYHAQLLSLRREFTHERTLDGRGDNGDSAIVWRFAGKVPVRAADGIYPPGGGPDGAKLPTVTSRWENA